MDALFLPLADAVGASVDQIKVCPAHRSNLRVSWLTMWTRHSFSLPAYIMSVDRLPSWKPLRPNSIHPTGSASSVQHLRRHSVFLPDFEDLFRVLPTPGQYFGDLLHCKIQQKLKNAVDCFRVNEISWIALLACLHFHISIVMGHLTVKYVISRHFVERLINSFLAMSFALFSVSVMRPWRLPGHRWFLP